MGSEKLSESLNYNNPLTDHWLMDHSLLKLFTGLAIAALIV